MLWSDGECNVGGAKGAYQKGKMSPRYYLHVFVCEEQYDYGRVCHLYNDTVQEQESQKLGGGNTIGHMSAKDARMMQYYGTRLRESVIARPHIQRRGGFSFPVTDLPEELVEKVRQRDGISKMNCVNTCRQRCIFRPMISHYGGVIDPRNPDVLLCFFITFVILTSFFDSVPSTVTRVAWGVCTLLKLAWTFACLLKGSCQGT